VPITRTPAATAYWTAIAPTPPVAPRHEQGLARLQRQRVERRRGGAAREAHGTGGSGVQRSRSPGHAVALADDDVLREAAVRSDVGRHHDAEDVVADGEAGNVGSYRFHRPGEVLAEHDREPVIHEIPDPPLGHGDVESGPTRRRP